MLSSGLMQPALNISKALAKDIARYTGPILEAQKRWQQMIAPYAADIERAARQMNDWHRKMQQALKAATPDLEAIIAAIEEQEKRFPDQVRTLAKHGWYLPPDLTPRAVHELSEALASGRATEVEATLIEHYSRELDNIEASLCKEAPTRERYLRSAFAAHRRGDYAASIPLMLAQADGLCRDFTGNHLFSGREKFVARFEDARPYVLSLLIAVRETMPLSENEKQRAGKAGLFNRHAIMHGESLDYDSAANSCRAISLLVYVAWALGEVHRDTPKDNHRGTGLPADQAARPASGQHPGRVRSKAASPVKKRTASPQPPPSLAEKTRGRKKPGE